MNRLKDIWGGQDDMNRVLLLIAVAVFAWSLIEGHGMYGALLAVVVEPEGVVGVALHPLAVCGKYYPVAVSARTHAGIDEGVAAGRLCGDIALAGLAAIQNLGGQQRAAAHDAVFLPKHQKHQHPQQDTQHTVKKQ